MELKKFFMEQIAENEYRRILIEQGTKEHDYAEELKQTSARTALGFLDGIVKAIIPAVIIGCILLFFIVWRILK